MKSERLELIDTIRGIAIISMIGFHTCWIMNYFGIAITTQMLYGDKFYIWERSICCTFIFISGFSFSLSRKHLKHSLLILSLGVAITILSVLFMRDLSDIFGVLWLLGISSLVTIAVDNIYDKYVQKQDYLLPIIFLTLSFILIVFTWNINSGFFGFGNIIITIPRELYNGYIMTLIGFMDPDFYSVDYFSIFPWVFLYLMGYFTYKITHNTMFEKKCLTKGIPVLNYLGKKSLVIYIIHPVVIYIVIYLWSLI